MEQSWVKSMMPVFASILSFLLGLIVLPILRAYNEKKRLTSTKTAVILWLKLIEHKIEYQIENLEEFIRILDNKTANKDSPFKVVHFLINHILNFKEEDLRNVLFEKLEEGGDANDYIDIISDLHYLKALEEHINFTYDKWLETNDSDMQKPIFQICLEESINSKASIIEYLQRHQETKIKSEYWIWS